MGGLEGLFDGSLEKLHRWKEVNRMQLYTISCNSRRMGLQMTILDMRMKISQNKYFFTKYECLAARFHECQTFTQRPRT